LQRYRDYKIKVCGNCSISFWKALPIIDSTQELQGKHEIERLIVAPFIDGKGIKFVQQTQIF